MVEQNFIAEKILFAIVGEKRIPPAFSLIKNTKHQDQPPTHIYKNSEIPIILDNII